MYTKIQLAIDNASNGDTILVENGTYLETVTIAKRINLIGNGSDNSRPVIDGQNSGTSLTVNANGVRIQNFSIIHGKPYGILGTIAQSTIANCSVSNNNYGASLTGNRNVIAFCDFVNNQLHTQQGFDSGLTVTGDNNQIFYNNASFNSNSNYYYDVDGMHIIGNANILSKNIMIGNSAYHQKGYGGYIVGNYNQILTNYMVGNFGGYGGSGLFTSGNFNIIANNTANRNFKDSYQSITYGIQITGVNNSITNNTCNDNFNGNTAGYGIYVEKGNNTIQYNTVNRNSYGIYTTSSNSTNVGNNNIVNNNYQGLTVDRSSHIIIENNYIDNSKTGNGTYFFTSHFNTLNNNTIRNSYLSALALSASNNNTITWNILRDNGNNGITLTSANGNTILQNDLINNLKQVEITGSTQNIWNSTLRLAYRYNDQTRQNFMGNYYDDYTGTDPDGDGIGSTPYSLSPGIEDYAPLVHTSDNYKIVMPIPVANFTGTPTTGTFPLTVTFTDFSTNTPESWNWSFGDGSSENATRQNPVHTYTTAGTFTVSVNVTNGGGSDTRTAVNYITVKVPVPITDFTANATSGTMPLTVRFTDQSARIPTGWAWNFGDGTTSTLQNPVHTYLNIGTYTVSLNATNAGGSTIKTCTDYITVTPPVPVANFTADTTSGRAPLTVPFTDRSTNTPTTWAWNFGDGITSSLQNPVHTYTTPGIYTVRLVAGNNGGSNTSVRSDYISVIIPAPVTNFVGTPRSGTFPLTVRFLDTSSNSPTSWSWSFGDGSQENATIQNPSHTYTTAGIYTVSLNATNAGGSNTKISISYISVLVPAPTAAFTGTPATGISPLTVTFTDQSTNTPTTWNWSFGDGAKSNSQNPSHTYGNAGIYSVTLTVSNPYGTNTTTKTNYITVNVPRPTLWNMSMNVNSGTYTQNLLMGSAASASRAYDAGLDIPMPPDPPGAKKIVYFSINDPLFDHLSTDYKPPVNKTNIVEYWTLYIKSNETVRIIWDTTQLSDPNLTYVWNDGTKTIDMRTTTNTTLPAGEYFVNLSASTFVNIDMRINGGWNLVSVPLTNARYIVPTNSIQTIYAYNPVTRLYEGPIQITTMEPGKAYWIASTRDCIVNVSGEPVYPITENLTGGWNLVGGSDKSVPFNAILIDPVDSWSLPFVFGYNVQTRLYEQITTLQTGKGYWGAVNRDCHMTVP
jgi:parallel beta-helix repeat protein